VRTTDLTGQPPALVITAGFDPLRDEGRVYADRLREAGVDVVYHEYPGQIHAFISLHQGHSPGHGVHAGSRRLPAETAGERVARRPAADCRGRESVHNAGPPCALVFPSLARVDFLAIVAVRHD
jgi:acetyl esterase/lipase